MTPVHLFLVKAAGAEKSIRIMLLSKNQGSCQLAKDHVTAKDWNFVACVPPSAAHLPPGA